MLVKFTACYGFEGLGVRIGHLTKFHAKDGVKKKENFMQILGACATTTKFLDYVICTFNILVSCGFPRKTAFGDNSPLYPHAQPTRTHTHIRWANLNIALLSFWFAAAVATSNREEKFEYQFPLNISWAKKSPVRMTLFI